MLFLINFIFALFLAQSVFGQRQLANELASDGSGRISKNNAAAVKARLSQKGVNYIATFLKDILIEQVAGKSPTNNEEFQIQIGAGTKAKLTDLNLIVQNGPAQLRTKTAAPKQALVEIPGIGFDCKAKIGGGIQTLGADRLIFRVADSTLFLNVSAIKHSQGAPNFRIEKCQLHLNKPLNVSVEGTEGQEATRNAMEKTLMDAGPQMLEQLVCSRVIFILEEHVNQRFGLLPSKLSLAQLNGTFIVDELMRRVGAARRQRRAESSGDSEAPQQPEAELFSSFNMSRADTLFLDYTIIDIRADDRGIEIDSSGEVSIRGRGGTPFGPMPFSLPEAANEEQMLQMLIADFMPNSLLYNGHTIGLFNARVDPSTPHFGPIMRTSCPSISNLLFCLGDFFPTLRRVHPDHGLALLFSTIQPPTIKFRPQSAGGISFSLLGKILMNLLGKGENNKMEEIEVAQMEISVEAHMKIRLSSATVRPKVQLDKIALKTLTPGIMVQEELDRSVLLAREVLQRLVNDILRGGIPIPVHPLLRLQKPKVKIMDRHLLLLTNLEFNEPLIRQITSATLDGRTI